MCFPNINMLDAVSLMPKRSINNTVAKVYKSDTTVKGNLSRDTSQQLIPVSFRLVHFHCEPHIPFYLCNDPHHHVYSTQQQMTRQLTSVLLCISTVDGNLGHHRCWPTK
jgi:hypothetical protein